MRTRLVLHDEIRDVEAVLHRVFDDLIRHLEVVSINKGKGTLLGTPNREPQEYSRYIIGIYLPGSLYSIIFLLYSWGSRFGVPSRVPLRGLKRESLFNIEKGKDPKETTVFMKGLGMLNASQPPTTLISIGDLKCRPFLRRQSLRKQISKKSVRIRRRLQGSEKLNVLPRASNWTSPFLTFKFTRKTLNMQCKLSSRPLEARKG